MSATPRAIAWSELYSMAKSQAGLFSTEQAQTLGFSKRILSYHTKTTRFLRVARGIYRFRDHPRHEQEDLVALWLWSQKAGVFSHETALELYGLSDSLSTQTHLTLPAIWKKRRIQVPKKAHLYFNDIDVAEETWVDLVPVTSLQKTLGDCIESKVEPNLVAQAIDEALNRKHLSATEHTYFKEHLRRSLL